METVVLSIHLILALLLIGVVLMQKNEGAGLLSGGGNMQARGQATALTKLTWILAAAFIATSIALTIMATRGGSGGSVVDSLMPPTTESATPPAGETTTGADMLPPATTAPETAPAVDPTLPPAGDAPATDGQTNP